MKKNVRAAGLAVVAVIAVLGAVLFTGCAKKPAPAGGTAAPAEYRLGLYAGLTGGNSAYGIELRNAVQLRVEEINAAGGLNGVPIKLITYDTQCSTEEAAKVAIKLIEQEKVQACIGSMNSGEVFAASPNFNRAGIYMLGTGTSPSWMKEDWPFVFRPAMNNDFAVPIAANLMTDLKYKTVAIFNGQEDAALTTADTFQKTFDAMGINVVSRESYDAGDTDFSGQIAKMLAKDPDCVLISVIGETGGPIVRQLRQNGYKGLILDKESFMFNQVEVAGVQNSDYVFFANPYVTYKSIDDCDIPNMKEFLQKYQARYGIMVGTDSAYRGWDAVNVFEAAAKLAGATDSESLKNATMKLKMEGLGGAIDFTKGNREAYNTFNSFILVDGKNIRFSDWLNGGGYEAYKAKTGRNR
jgi:branched-chain amino acid transport system substrate-binding protein